MENISLEIDNEGSAHKGEILKITDHGFLARMNSVNWRVGAYMLAIFEIPGLDISITEQVRAIKVYERFPMQASREKEPEYVTLVEMHFTALKGESMEAIKKYSMHMALEELKKKVMRIIAGQYRGRKLKAFKANHIRPTTDRVKETLFNMIQAQVPDARVLDLFSGTGNLGIEALSRGASYVEFVEKNSQSIQILKDNLGLLKITEGVNVVKKDVIAYLKSIQEGFDLIFIDPPFTKKMAHEVLQVLGSSEALKLNSIVAIESGTGENVEKAYSKLQLLDQRAFGDKTLHLYSVSQED